MRPRRMLVLSVELFEQLALPARQFLRDLDLNPCKKIPAASGRTRTTLALDTEDLPGAGSGGHFECHGAVERRHLDLGAERSLCDRDRKRYLDIAVLLHFEERVLGDVNPHVQVTRRASGG